MNNYLRNLSPTHQVAALFVIVFGLLFIVSTVAFMLSFRERRNPVHSICMRRAVALPTASMVKVGNGVTP